MSQNPHATSVAVLLSGGLDSALLLGNLLAQRQQVVPFYVRTGCLWQGSELRAAKQFLAAVACPALSELIVLDLPVADLYGQHWSVTGADVPDQFTADDAVYLPGRNPLILMKPALWCRLHGLEKLAIATLAANPFDDATPEFFVSFEEMIARATGGRIEILRPFEKLTKQQALRLGGTLPLELTFSCLRPVEDRHCGACNKCGERRAAFRDAGIRDSTPYANSIRHAI